jgi:outer membrane immunogenic protein
MKNSKLILSAAVAIGAIMNVAVVSAADFRAFPYTKAPPMVPIDPLISWAGFYAGVNVGGLWAHSDIRDVDAYASAAIPGTVTAINRSGFLGGGQVGYSWQASNYLFGVEVDGGYMDLGGTTPLTGTRSGTRVGLRSGAYGDFTGRVGVTFNRALFYAKGGYAVLEDASSFSTVSGSFSGLRKYGTDSGYTIGAGVEYKFAPNWSAKVEYLHFDFGDNLSYTVFNTGGTPFRFNQNLRMDTVKAGLNYAWGSPVIARD